MNRPCPHCTSLFCGPVRCRFTLEKNNAAFAHGHAAMRTGTYTSWMGMRARCNKQSDINYRRYGARGIKVCERWDSFENFLADMGPRPEGMSIERKDGNKGYFPDNCVWATRKQQQRNLRSNRYLEINGERLLILDWAKRVGLTVWGIRWRLKRGMTPKEAVFTPRQR